MTTTEFIKQIKFFSEDRKKLLASNWEGKGPIYLITESEFNKIEKVNVELLKALKDSLQMLEQTLYYRNANKITGGNVFLETTIDESKKAIKNAEML